MDGNEESANPHAGRRLLAILVGIVLALVAGLAMLRFFVGGMPRIQPGDLEQARERWDSAAIDDYRLTVVLSGRQSGELKIEVRDGRPTGLTRNGNPVPAERSQEPWTVPGMFETLELDFDNAPNAVEKFGGEVVMRAEFDPQYGFPRRYLHQIQGVSGDLEWKVTEFTPL